MRNGFRALGAASIAVVQVAAAQTALAAEQTAVVEEAGQTLERAGHGDFVPPGPRRFEGRAGRQMPGLDVPPEAALAACLAILETRIGIRAEQLNAWRDFTSALQALLSPPGPRHFDPRESRPEAMPGGPPQLASDAAKGPFAREEALADDFVKRAEAAQKLKLAISALRTTLTPEQQAILASALHPWGPEFDPGGRGRAPEDAAGPAGGHKVGHP
ncbi:MULTISPECIES: Spy/CpxP family protein refolding chaperone [Ensifer]|uniref:Spy/CpxP family protein refolding chaperone n=1 Tax=Ensifer TaxID=106591 RepID=UPI00070E9C4F|nr:MULTISPECIES: Spy/CpxP family protein refolding chaperone [Ensifer]KQW60538.1 hypothetical protein ASD02_25440 [Ensifer sp. Root1252]KQW72558.1 hypothetical protein ASD03_31290 [Ensifer sp. Root127]KRC99759.1 hypothetical protein ASE47_26335 [Ensifer sp. Root258]NOV20883.1 hypothetical protein [Ensifer canadensis]